MTQDTGKPPERRPLNVLNDQLKVRNILERASLNAAERGRPDDAPAADLAPPQSVDEVALFEKVVEVIKTVYDPEIPVNIYEMGLIYGVDVTPGGHVKVRMTLTAPSCPVAETLPLEVQGKIGKIPEVTRAEVELVWDPPWTKDRMSEAAKLELGLF